jgi:hypothetical protein
MPPGCGHMPRRWTSADELASCCGLPHISRLGTSSLIAVDDDADDHVDSSDGSIPSYKNLRVSAVGVAAVSCYGSF